MTKPMYCPFRSRAKTWLDFLFFQSDEAECTPDCAWSIVDLIEKDHCCGIALMAWNLSNAKDYKSVINWAPLKDNNEK